MEEMIPVYDNACNGLVEVMGMYHFDQFPVIIDLSKICAISKFMNDGSAAITFDHGSSQVVISYDEIVKLWKSYKMNINNS